MNETKKQEKITTIKMDSHDIHLWRGLFMQLFHDKSLDLVAAYVQTTMDFLKSKGYTIVKEESKDA